MYSLIAEFRREEINIDEVIEKAEVILSQRENGNMTRTIIAYAEDFDYIKSEEIGKAQSLKHIMNGFITEVKDRLINIGKYEKAEELEKFANERLFDVSKIVVTKNTIEVYDMGKMRIFTL